LGRSKKSYYFAEVYAIIRELLSQGKGEAEIDNFIVNLKLLNEKHLAEISADSYHRSGGAFALSLENAAFAANFVNAYAEGFRLALRAGMDDKQIERRAMMYPTEGFRLAVLNAQRQALHERGARKWRRMLHPELSEAGPCQQCMADAEVLHDIEDPFVEFHPNGVCSQQFLVYTMEGRDIEIPVPSDEADHTRRRWAV